MSNHRTTFGRLCNLQYDTTWRCDAIARCKVFGVVRESRNDIGPESTRIDERARAELLNLMLRGFRGSGPSVLTETVPFHIEGCTARSLPLWTADDQFVVVDETGGCELRKVDWVREAEIDFVWHWFGDGVEGPVNL